MSAFRDALSSDLREVRLILMTCGWSMCGVSAVSPAVSMAVTQAQHVLGSGLLHLASIAFELFVGVVVTAVLVVLAYGAAEGRRDSAGDVLGLVGSRIGPLLAVALIVIATVLMLIALAGELVGWAMAFARGDVNLFVVILVLILPPYHLLVATVFGRFLLLVPIALFEGRGLRAIGRAWRLSRKASLVLMAYATVFGVVASVLLQLLAAPRSGGVVLTFVSLILSVSITVVVTALQAAAYRRLIAAETA